MGHLGHLPRAPPGFPHVRQACLLRADEASGARRGPRSRCPPQVGPSPPRGGPGRAVGLQESWKKRGCLITV
eukprot:6484617-Pyramimonas_sp.AAC.1